MRKAMKEMWHFAAIGVVLMAIFFLPPTGCSPSSDRLADSTVMGRLQQRGIKWISFCDLSLPVCGPKGGGAEIWPLLYTLHAELWKDYPNAWLVIEDRREAGNIKYQLGMSRGWRLAVYEQDGHDLKLVATAPLLDPAEAVKSLVPTIRVEDAGDPNSPQS